MSKTKQNEINGLDWNIFKYGKCIFRMYFLQDRRFFSSEKGVTPHIRWQETPCIPQWETLNIHYFCQAAGHDRAVQSYFNPSRLCQFHFKLFDRFPNRKKFSLTFSLFEDSLSLSQSSCTPGEFSPPSPAFSLSNVISWDSFRQSSCAALEVVTGPIYARTQSRIIGWRVQGPCPCQNSCQLRLVDLHGWTSLSGIALVNTGSYPFVDL